MKIKTVLESSINPLALGELVFTDFEDVASNPRPGLGYHQLYDPTKMISLIAKLPEVTRVGDTITLYWDDANVQQYDLDQPTIDKGWLSFSVSPSVIMAPQASVYYTLFDNNATDLQTSATRTVAVNRKPPGGLDPNTETAINEALAPCTVSPDPVSNPGAPVTVSVPPWTDQELGDELTVMWNNLRVDHPKLTALGAQNVIIPKEVLEAGGSSDKLMVNYEIRDIVDNYSLVSPATFVRVEIDPDALTAPRVKEANQTTLILDLEALGDSNATVQIPPYVGNRQPYVVTLTWIGKTPTAEIGLTLPPQTVADPDFDHAEFTIPNADLKQIAGGSAVLRYALLQTGDTVEKQSKTTSITLTGLPVQLQAPVVPEAGGTTTIDLALITGDNVTVLIPAYAGQSAGDKILLSWKGTTADGQPVNYTDEYVIKAGEELKNTTFSVPRENIDPLGGGSLGLSYQVVFATTGSTQNSPVMTYTVKPLAAQILPPPTAKEAAAGVLDPMKALAGATVTVAYDGMLPTDTIALIWDGDNAAVPWQVGNASGTVDFLIPVNVLAAVVGKTFEVAYGVIRGAEVLSSQLLHLTVSEFAQSDLPTPAVTEAVAGVLDLNEFEGDAHVTVEPWPLIAVGQTVWLTVIGPGGVPTIKLLEGYAIGAQEVSGGINSPVKRAELEKLEDGSELRVVCGVGFDGNQELALPQLTLSIKIIIEPFTIFENFEAWPSNYLPLGSVEYKTITYTFSDIAAKVYGPTAPEFSPILINKVLATAGSIEIRPKQPMKSIRFGIYIYRDQIPIDISYFNKNDQLMFSERLNATGSARWVDHPSNTTRIAYITFTAPGPHIFQIDNLTIAG